MQRRRWIIATLGLLAALAVAPAPAQDYPTRPVRIVTDSAPGSAIDVILRIVADRLTQMWGQQVVAANHPGAGGSIAARVAAQAAPDGYTLFIPALSTFVAPPGAAANLPLQVPRDFAPVGYFGGAPMFITAASWLGVKTLPELIALAKQKPGELDLRHQRARPAHASHWRTARQPRRHQAPDDPLFRRHRAGAQ